MKDTPENCEKQGIKKLVQNLGGYLYTNGAGLGRKRGLPDITVLIKGVVIQVEVKGPKGTQSPEQKEFQMLWEVCGGNYFCGTLEGFCDYLQKKRLLKIQ
ncbi:MAG: hypothetical protein COY66_05835 [Candidatus Kerfeldbacteria bacterium CG_4_10_14_0_8_um_filter_42_10]|uniref:VRR-NUC domain-containing protein n=1 Tax=Candidatus Kerfeldbacteria bacterium CG_4_10_14_0_8_um_filter_42_10 TaxID=2014248 RepID=A0A2M7RHI2_9BACT|nr:MAG: hypothetical protein COY66_05835 [Candidatus Kerfeldbacteria bacterium CG_4_10_14_0_8_um_filter_42_10]